MILSETIPGGWNFSHRLKRGQALRLTDLDGRANAAFLAYNAWDPSERYNMPDTLKAQFTACLTKNLVLYSDMGRILLSVVQDDLGWHDTMTGFSTPESTLKKYGPTSYQEHRNERTRDARTSLLVELGKYNLGRRDLGGGVNWFTKIQVDGQGGLAFVPGHTRPGASVTLRAEMDTLVVLNTCPHPLDPSPIYAPGRVLAEVFAVPEPGPDDPCFQSPQNRRGWENTRRLAGWGGAA